MRCATKSSNFFKRMKYKAFGPAGVELPVIGQGTWNMPESGARLKEAQRAIRRGIELGMTHIDTAEMYGAGRVEELVGEAIRGIARERLFIATKVLPSNASYRGTLAAAERSLARLSCDYLDLYLLHWPGSHPLEADDARVRGARRTGQDAIRRRQQLRGRRDDRGGIVFARDGAGLQPSPLSPVRTRNRARGASGGSQRAASRSSPTRPSDEAAFLRSSARRRERLERIARKHDATLRQVALAFLTRERDVFAIPKAASVEHVEENADAGDLELDADDVATIDAAFPRGRPGPLATLDER